MLTHANLFDPMTLTFTFKMNADVEVTK